MKKSKQVPATLIVSMAAIVTGCSSDSSSSGYSSYGYSNGNSDIRRCLDSNGNELPQRNCMPQKDYVHVVGHWVTYSEDYGGTYSNGYYVGGYGGVRYIPYPSSGVIVDRRLHESVSQGGFGSSGGSGGGGSFGG